MDRDFFLLPLTEKDVAMGPSLALLSDAELKRVRKRAGDRGQATHVAMKLLQADANNVIRLASTRRLPELMRHKAERLVDRVRRTNKGLDMKFLRADEHQLWASLCCRHMAEYLERTNSSVILSIEAKLPDVSVNGFGTVDTGDVDILTHSESMGGLHAIEIKNRLLTDDCSITYGRAMENAAGIMLMGARNGWPPLKAMTWVFYTPHPKDPNIPIAQEKVVDFSSDNIVRYFENRHGGMPFLPFLL